MCTPLVHMLVVASGVCTFFCLVWNVQAQPPAPDPRYSPADVIGMAADDAARLGSNAKYYRWLSLANLPPSEREAATQVLGGLLNSLSREPDIVRPTSVAGGLLLRISTEDYGPTFAKAWEQLSRQEPYYHVSTTSVEGDDYEVVDVEYGFWVRPNGTGYTGARENERDRWQLVRTEKERRRKPKVNVGRIAPWVVQKAKAKLELLIGLTQSEVPVVAGEWFLIQTAIQADRAPGYYDFLGIKDEASYQKVVGYIDKGVDPGFLRELRESVALSTVTLQPRAIERHEKIGGGLWRTRDVRIAKNKGNPLRVLDNTLQFDATEQIAHLPNGLTAFLLADSKGVRQDSAPDFIASDSTAPYNDRRVHIYLSCVRCHVDGTIQDINGWVRNVLNSPPNFIVAEKPEEAKKLRQQYVRRLEPYLSDDRRRYALAISEATGGLTPEKYSAALAELWKRRAEDPVTVDRAARDLGCTTEVLQKALSDAGTGVDPVLSAFRLPRPQPISVTSWHESYANGQLAISGYTLIPPKK